MFCSMRAIFTDFAADAKFDTKRLLKIPHCDWGVVLQTLDCEMERLEDDIFLREEDEEKDIDYRGRCRN